MVQCTADRRRAGATFHVSSCQVSFDGFVATPNLFVAMTQQHAPNRRSRGALHGAWGFGCLGSGGRARHPSMQLTSGALGAPVRRQLFGQEK